MENKDMRFRVDGKVVMVTGAARGIGARCAEVLAEVGARVVICDILEEQGKKLADGIRKAGGEAVFCRHDVTDEKQWSTVINAAIKTFGRFDVLVNNAGIDRVSLIENIPVEQWRMVMTVNAESVFIGTKQAILAMKPGGIAGKGGSIVNMSSIGGLVAFVAQGSYSAAKGAVRLLTKVAAIECGKLKYGIRVNSVHPGMIKTDMVSGAYTDFQKLDLAPSIGRNEIVVGSPDDIAQAVLYLASGASAFVTGAEFIVDNGYTAQ